MIIGISGLAGTGKDTAADMLVRNHGFVKVSLADPIKRICRDVFAFTDDQLFGPSESRNAEDRRYPRYRQGDVFAVMMAAEGVSLSLRSSEEIAELWRQKMGNEPMWLTPRYALQTLGTEWGRNCYDDIWVEYAVRIYQQLQIGDCYYDAKTGLRMTTSVSNVMEPKKNVVVSDVRFKNEIAGLKKAGAKLIRIRRPGYETPRWNHPSETEQLDIPDDEFDFVIRNSGDLEDLAQTLAVFILDQTSEPVSI